MHVACTGSNCSWRVFLTCTQVGTYDELVARGVDFHQFVAAEDSEQPEEEADEDGGKEKKTAAAAAAEAVPSPAKPEPAALPAPAAPSAAADTPSPPPLPTPPPIYVRSDTIASLVTAVAAKAAEPGTPNSGGANTPTKPARFGGGSLRRLGSSMRRSAANGSSGRLVDVEREAAEDYAAARTKLVDTMAKKEKDGKIVKVAVVVCVCVGGGCKDWYREV